MNSPLAKADFLGLDQHTWLYTGAESPPHRGVKAAVENYLEGRQHGPDGRERNADIEEKCKSNLAALLNAAPAQIALLSNASEAISHLALAFDWKAGDNVIINTLEFPSGALPWLALKAQGVEIRVVEHRNYDFSVEDILAQVDENTRLVMTSHVSYLSGARLDHQTLYQELQRTDALLLLDSTQALGVVTVDATQADFVVSSTYKWLLAMHGAGVLCVNPARTRELTTRFVGWRSVREMFAPNRFENFERHEDARQWELGYPAYATLYALEFSSGLLRETGIERIENHVLQLGDQLIASLDKLGVALLTPRARARRAGNIAFVCARGEELADRLRERGIFLWGGDGRARASIHGFNDAGDIELLLQELRQNRELL